MKPSHPYKLRGLALLLALGAASPTLGAECGESYTAPVKYDAKRHLYLSPYGLDGNDCSPARPCRSLERVVRGLIAGDVVHLAKGKYLGAKIEGLFGTAEKPIVFVAEQGPAEFEVPQFKRGQEEILTIRVSRHLVFDGLLVRNTWGPAFRLFDSTGITIRNSTFVRNRRTAVWAINCKEFRFERNKIDGAHDIGLKIEDASSQAVVRWNEFRDIRSTALLIASGAGGTISGAVVEGNRLFKNGKAGRTGAIQLEGLQDSVVVNNLLVDNLDVGIFAAKGRGKRAPSGLLIAHNTIYQAASASTGILLRVLGGPVTVQNNLVVHPNTKAAALNFDSGSDLRNTTSSHNRLDRVALNMNPRALAEWRGTYPAQEKESAEVPALREIAREPSRSDYGLPAVSGIRGKGLSVPQVPRDLTGKCRPSPPSIGAFE